MDLATRARSLGRWQLAAVSGFVVALAASLLHGALVSPAVAFLGPPRFAPWIQAPRTPMTDGIHIALSNPPITAFERRFVLEARPSGPVLLRLRALQELEMTWNGAPVPLDARDARNWKRVHVQDVTALPVAGENVLRVIVRNPAGPPLLQLAIDGPGIALASDESWSASFRARPATPAVVADDRVPWPETAAQPTPAQEMARRAAPLLGLAALGVIALFATRHARLRSLAIAHGEAAAIALLALFWLALYVRASLWLPANVGFDAAGHLDYVRLVAREARIPTAAEGFSMYHPPLYHALSAALLALVHPRAGGAGERALLGLLPALAGLGAAFLARALARRLAPGDAALHVLALLGAGLLPVNLYIACFVSNEAPHAALASAAILATASLVTAERATRRAGLMIGLLLGAALLTKYTSLVLLPILAATVAARLRFVDGAPWPRALAAGAAVAMLALAIASPFYARNLALFGEPTPTNMSPSVRPGEGYWQTPGFHTLGYFLAFGDSFVRPWQAGFRSFADSVYTTLWGDAAASGLRSLAMRHALWDWGWMGTLWPLAAPATLLALLGAGVLAVRAARGDDLRARIAATLLVAVPLALAGTLLSVALRVPYATVPKAFYALGASGPFAICLAIGLRTADGWLGRVAGLGGRALLWAPMAALAGAIVMTFGTKLG